MTKGVVYTIRQIDILKTIRNYYRVVIKFIKLKKVLDTWVWSGYGSFIIGGNSSKIEIKMTSVMLK